MALSVPRLLPTKTYPFSEWRHMLGAMGIQPGVVENEFKVVQRAAGGANMSVDVGAADQGAWIKGVDTTRQGIYHVFNDAIVNLAIAPNPSGNPRIDQVVIRLYDSSVIGGAQDQGALEVIQGAPAVGAQAANPAAANYRAGAVNLAAIAAPKSVLLHADIVVPAGAASITNANIIDRRRWARGAFRRIVRTANAAAGTDYGTTSVALTEIDPTNLKPRIECSGAPLRIRLQGYCNHTTAGGVSGFGINVDGAGIDAAGILAQQHHDTVTAQRTVSVEYIAVPTPGSHLIAPTFVTNSPTMAVFARPLSPLTLVIEELMRQNADNT